MMKYDPSNIFARILRGEVPCNKVFENDVALAFHDISPAAPVHVLVLPKGEYCSFNDFATSASAEDIAAFFSTVQHVANMLDLQQDGYRLIMNHGANASQTVPHFHAHILGGKQLGPLLTDDKLLR